MARYPGMEPIDAHFRLSKYSCYNLWSKYLEWSDVVGDRVTFIFEDEHQGLFVASSPTTWLISSKATPEFVDD